MKKLLLFLLAFFASSFAFAQQQIPKIGIVNYSKIIQKVMPNQEVVKEIKAIKKSMDDFAAATEEEISKLEAESTDLLLSGKSRDARKIDDKIDSMRQSLEKFSSEKKKELEEKMALMPDTSKSLENVFDQIQRIAEGEGYSIIFDSNDKSIIWWSQSVDITDLVMKKLK